MRYFNSPSGAVFGYDAEQAHLVAQAISNGWPEVTGNWPPAKTAADLDAEQTATAKAALLAIDLATIRALREYIAAKPDAPQILKDREAAAVAERAKLAVEKAKI